MNEGTVAGWTFQSPGVIHPYSRIYEGPVASFFSKIWVEQVTKKEACGWQSFMVGLQSGHLTLSLAAPVSSIQGMYMCFTTVVQYISLSVFVSYNLRKKAVVKQRDKMQAVYKKYRFSCNNTLPCVFFKESSLLHPHEPPTHHCYSLKLGNIVSKIILMGKQNSQFEYEEGFMFNNHFILIRDTMGLKPILVTCIYWIMRGNWKTQRKSTQVKQTKLHTVNRAQDRNLEL